MTLFLSGPRRISHTLFLIRIRQDFS